MASQTGSYDVIVVGAGIEGSSSAYAIAKAGKKVLLIEQFPLPHSRGSSGGHSRITRYVYNEDYYVNMMMDCFPMWDQLAQESGSELFVPCGTLDLRDLKSEGARLAAQAMRKHNIPHQLLGSSEVSQRFPMLSPGAGFGALWDPQGGLLRADKCLAAFQKMFKQLGGVIRDAEPVTSIIPGDSVTVVTSKSVYKAPKLVVAAGPWAKQFTSSLGLSVPLQPIRINVLYWSPIPGKEGEHSFEKMPCLIDARDGDGTFSVYALPEEEYPGLVKVCLHVGPDISPDERDRVNSQWVREKVSNVVKGLFPWLRHDAATIEETCIYTVTPDHNPYIDTHPNYSNVVIAAGFSGHGFKLAPAVGKAVSELALGKPVSYDMAPFKLDRFSPKANL